METMAAKKADVIAKTESIPVRTRRDPHAKPQEVLRELRWFHLAGAREGVAGDVRKSGYLPVLLHQFRGTEEVRNEYPLFLAPAGSEYADRLVLAIGDLLERAAPSTADSRVLRDNLPRLERQVRRAMKSRRGPVDAHGILTAAGEGFAKELKLSADEEPRLRADLEALAAAVPAGGRFLAYGEQAGLFLFEQAALGRTSSALASFLEELRTLVGRVRSLLQVDRLNQPGADAAEAMGETLGGAASDLVDTSALTGVLGSRRLGAAMTPARRERLQSTLKTLDAYLAEADTASVTLVHDGSMGEEAMLGLENWTLVASEDPCATAAECFDEASGELAAVLRAAQVGRLELEGAYDPVRHDPWLAELNWEAFSRDELHMVRPVAAVVSADRTARGGGLSLSRLLLSGRPVQVLMMIAPARNPGRTAEEGFLAGYRFEPGYVGMSHREALVQQSSAARPFHLLEGFRRGLDGTRAGLHVLASGRTPEGGIPAVGTWLALGAALDGRAHACFRYDPELGTSWSRRLDFSGNSDPDADWPVYEFEFKDEDGRTETMSLPFTFADFALVDPALSDQFRAIPDGLPEDEIVPVAAYLELEGDATAHKIPFVWGADGKGGMTRLAVTRRLALAARDRKVFWRILQELAGIRNAYAIEAAESTREELEAKATAEREARERKYAEELERVRARGADEAISQLTAALMDVDPAALASTFGGGMLSGLQGKSADEVAQVLMGLVGPDRLEAGAAPGADSGRVDAMAGELMNLIDPEQLDPQR